MTESKIGPLIKTAQKQLLLIEHIVFFSIYAQGATPGGSQVEKSTLQLMGIKFHNYSTPTLRSVTPQIAKPLNPGSAERVLCYGYRLILHIVEKGKDCLR